MRCELSVPTVLGVAAAAWLGSAGVAPASLVINIPNYSFEAPALADGAYTDPFIVPNPVPNWFFIETALDAAQEPVEGGFISAGTWDPAGDDYANAAGDDATLPGAAVGGQAAYVYLEQDPPPLGALPLTLIGSLTSASPIATVDSSTRYDLSVAVGNARSFDIGQVQVQLLVNEIVMATTFADATTLNDDMFSNVTASFTTVAGDALEGGALKIRLVHVFDGVGLREVEFDNIRLESTVVPEPAAAVAAMTLLCGGALSRGPRGPRRPRRHRGHSRGRGQRLA